MDVEELRLQLARREAELEAMRRVNEAMGSAFGSQEMLQGIAEIGRQVTDTDVCEIYLIPENGEELVLKASTENQDLIDKVSVKIGEGITGMVALERQPVGVNQDAYKDPRSKYVPILHEEDYESFLAVPLLVRDKLLGVITVRTTEPHDYSPEEEMLLAGVAGQVSGTIETMSRLSELEHQAVQYRTLAHVGRMLSSTAYLEEILQLLVSETSRQMNYRVCTLRLLDEESQELLLHASIATSRAYLNKPSIKLGESVAGVAVKENRTVTVEDVQSSPDYLFPEIAREQGLRSLICVPLTLAGKALGVLSCYKGQRHNFTRDEIRTLETIAGQAAIAVSHARLSARDTLMQEMHHRVKNNLQQIASLLRMSMQHSEQKPLEEHLAESLNRIQAIATVHDLLSRDDLEFVRLKAVAEAILMNLIQGFAPPDCHIRVAIEGEDVRLPMNQANHVALVLNELAQNAIEHGFIGGGEYVIEISIGVQQDHVEIQVRNNGRPLPDGFDLASSKGMGLSICESIVRSGLAGKFAITQADMTVAVFTFHRG